MCDCVLVCVGVFGGMLVIRLAYASVRACPLSRMVMACVCVCVCLCSVFTQRTDKAYGTFHSRLTTQTPYDSQRVVLLVSMSQ